jgi:hypothetical protein
MGIDKSLSDTYPSVIIDGSRYHYGRDKASGEYLVEHESIALDTPWTFKEKEDLQAFLINLPESAYPHRRFKLHPDWRAVSSEQRDAYAEQDRLLFRGMAAERVRNGTAQSFNMDFEGEHGPYPEPQRIEGRSEEPPIERVERQLRDWKTFHSSIWERGLNEAGKLRVLEGELDWTGVAVKDKEGVLAREIDFAKITPEEFAFVHLDTVSDRPLAGIDPAVAQTLFDRSRAQTGTQQIRESKPVDIITREVDLARVPEERRERALQIRRDVEWEREETPKRDEPDANIGEVERTLRKGLESGEVTDTFAFVAANLRQQWYDDGYGSPRDSWEELPAEDKIAYLAEFGAAHRVSFERFVDAAASTLGLASLDAFTPEDVGRLLDQYRETLERHGYRPDRERPPYAGTIANGRDDTPAPQANQRHSRVELADHRYGQYQVWHDRGWPQSRIDQMLDGWPPSAFLADYFHAADVRAGSLQEAVQLTTSKGHLLNGDHQPWDTNEAVRSYTPKPFVPRDTDTGDVIVDPQGLTYRVERDGFSEVKAADQCLPSPAAIADDRDGVPTPEGAIVADRPAQYQSPPESIELARELMREIKEALTTDADGKFTAKYADVEWEGMNMQPEDTPWQHMDIGQRYDLLLHALDESIWSLEPSAKWDEMRDSQKLAMEFVKEDMRQSTPDFRADVVAGLMAEMEAFSDEFSRQARTKEQKVLAAGFETFVGDAHKSVVYIAEASREYGSTMFDHAAAGVNGQISQESRLPSPGEIVRDGTSGLDVESIGGRDEDFLPPRRQRLSPIGEEQRRAMAAFSAQVTEITQNIPGGDPEIADAWRAKTGPERLDILADQAMDSRMDEEVFVRTARRVLGWREPTAEQRELMSEAWVRVETRAIFREPFPSPGEMAEDDRGGPEPLGPERGNGRGR